MDIRPKICDACEFYDGFPVYPDYEETCKAYPKGIPMDILMGADHREPRPDDHGIQFNMREGGEDALQTYEIVCEL